VCRGARAGGGAPGREFTAILELADELKDNTIELLSRKSDLEVDRNPGAARPGASPPPSVTAELSGCADGLGHYW
jgi:hypothetical protein